MNIELWKKRKKELNLTIDEIAKKANLPKGSVQNIFAGYVPDPRASTVEAIEKALGLNKPNANKGVWIPVYGNIAAGIPIEAIEDIIDQEEIPTEMTNNGEYIALRVKGSSMEPRIKEGDVVIIKRQETIENGEIAAVLVNGNDVTLKQVKVEFGLFPLTPLSLTSFTLKKSVQTYPFVFSAKWLN